MPSKKEASSEKKITLEPVKSVTIADDSSEYVQIADELDQIRQCLGMYVGSDAKMAAMHLVSEVTANSLDEETRPDTVGHTIWFTFLEKECKFIIEDDGRGIPHELLPEIIAKKHYSTKFGRQHGQYSAGQNGVGSTVTAALSSHYLITSYRNGLKRTVRIVDDKLVNGPIEPGKEGKHGTYVEFIPSQKWLGKFDIATDDVDEFLRNLSYVMPSGITIKYLGVPRKGQEIAHNYQNSGLTSAVDFLSANTEFATTTFDLPDIVSAEDGMEPERFRIEFAFNFDRTLDDPIVTSYCNMLHTKEGGTHEQVVMQALGTFFSRAAKNLDPNAKYEVSTDDVRRTLLLAVNCQHNNPSFEGQHKSKVSQKGILRDGRAPIIDALTKYYETHNGDLRKIITYLRTLSKARQEAHKVKNTALKKPMTALDDADLGKMFFNITDRNYSGYKELIIVEGDSALSAVDAARNTKCQAIFGVRGVVPNTYATKTEKVVVAYMVFQALVKVLGCGIGKDFDMAKLRYNAIILSMDSDVDGFNICSLICLFFMIHLPQIVLAGKLYRLCAPLYLISDKSMKKAQLDRNFLFDKLEYYRIFHRSIVNAMRISLVHPRNISEVFKGHGDVEMLDKKSAMQFLQDTVNYADELDTLSKRAFCVPIILEYVCYFKVMAATSPDPKKTFTSLITKRFPELHYDEELESLQGSYNGGSVTLIVDAVFDNMAKRLIRMIAEMPAFYVLVENRRPGDDKEAQKPQLMAFGEFIELCNKLFAVEVLQRFKGVGETETELVFASMMNPLTRKLLRLTMTDIMQAKATMQLLHEDSNDMREARRELLRNANITLQDIDN